MEGAFRNGFKSLENVEEDYICELTPQYEIDLSSYLSPSIDK